MKVVRVLTNGFVNSYAARAPGGKGVTGLTYEATLRWATEHAAKIGGRVVDESGRSPRAEQDRRGDHDSDEGTQPDRGL